MILLIPRLNMSFEKDEIVLKSVHCSTAPQTPRPKENCMHKLPTKRTTILVDDLMAKNQLRTYTKMGLPFSAGNSNNDKK